MSKPSFTVLTHEGVLSVSGIDAKKFLQGQITCNLDYLNDQKAGLGARCNPKGRMISSFRILQEPQGYLLAMDRALVLLQIEELKKYAMFSKSTLSDVSDQWVRLGLLDAELILDELGLELADEQNAVSHANHLIAIRLSPHLTELWVSAEEAPCLIKRLSNHAEQTTLNDWFLGLIRAGIAHVTTKTTDSFIPQIYNFPALGAVSFRKGCYSGQEIVARMQYLGKLKRHLYRFKLDQSSLPDLGTPLFSTAQRNPIGEVVLAATTDGHVELLAIALEEATLTDDVLLGSAEGPALSLLPLPYNINPDEEIKH